MSKKILLGFMISFFALGCGGKFGSAQFSDSIQRKNHALAHGWKMEVGSDHIQITNEKGLVAIDLPTKSPFLAAALATTEAEYHMASFSLEEEAVRSCSDQSISDIQSEESSIAISGALTGEGCESGYTITFRPVSSTKLEFDIQLEDSELNRVYFRHSSQPDESVYGFGEQFSHLNLKGEEPYLFTEEQGIGRGDQPITAGANLMAGAGGDEYSTYYPSPYFTTNQNRTVYYDHTGYSSFDLTEPNWISAQFWWSNQIHGTVYVGESLADRLVEFTGDTGRYPELPEWAFGTWLGVQGGKEKVLGVLEDAQKAGNPVTAIWIQDWVGRRKTSFGSQLWWRWIADEKSYPDFQKFCSDLNRKGIHVLGYINPFLADEGPLFEEARSKGYLVKNSDGKDYEIQTAGFPAYLLDLTNPQARDWVKGIIKKNMIGMGLSGWMADFGEWLPLDAKLHSGETGETYHNRYPVEWAKVNREAIREAGKEGEVVFFTRAGFTGSNKYSTLFWEGDQMVSFGQHDGLPSAVVGMLSGGLSGIALNHSDIGGYTTINNPLKDYHRSKELLLRWAEMSAFTPVFRSHEGNRPEENHQIYTDPETVQTFAKIGRIHYALKDYFRELNGIASRTGLPIVRPLVLEYPKDPNTLGLQTEFLVGKDLLVIPVLENGKSSVDGYLPAGEWEHVWTGKTYQGEKNYEFESPIGTPTVLVRKGGEWSSRIKEALQAVQK